MRAAFSGVKKHPKAGHQEARERPQLPPETLSTRGRRGERQTAHVLAHVDTEVSGLGVIVLIDPLVELTSFSPHVPR